MDIYQNICFLAIFASVLIRINSECETRAALFIFGDSLFDPRAISPPINSNPRCNHGRIIPDFIAQYAGLSFIPPYRESREGDPLVQGSNFACWGAGAIQGGDVDLKKQLKQYQNVTKLLKYTLGEAEATKIISDAVYMFSIGTNDYASYGGTSSQENYISMVIGNITYVVEGIYDEGGRKFAFMGLLPIGCLPQKRLETLDCNANLNKLARKHNKAFPKVLKNLQEDLSGFKFSIFDFYNTSSQRINHPSKYGFDEARIACCPHKVKCCDDPCAYVFINNHPSEKANEQFAQLAWSGTFPLVVPYNFKTLFKL